MIKGIAREQIMIRARFFSISILFGIAAWSLDAFMDHVYFYAESGTYLDLLIFNVPPHELYIRIIITALFVVFGIAISVYSIKQQQAGLELQVKNRELEEVNEDLSRTVEELEATNEELASINEELNQTHHDLEQSEMRFRELFNNIASGVAVYSALDEGKDFIFVDFNIAAEKIERVTKKDLIGRSVLEVFPGVRDFGLFDVFVRVWKTGAPEYHPIALYQDERLMGWRENNVMKLPSGEIVAIYEDVTEKKIAEIELQKAHDELELRVNERTEQLTESNRKLLEEIKERIEAEDALALFRRYVETSSEGMGWADIDGAVRYLNPALCSMLGLDRPEEVYGAPVQQFYDDKTQKRLADEIFPIVLSEGSWSGELNIMTRRGASIPSAHSLFIIKDRSDHPICFANVVTDLTERKKAEEELRKHRDHLEELVSLRTEDLNNANRELEQIVYVTSHDLRSPLVNIEGYGKEIEHNFKDLSGILKSESIPSDLQERAREIIEVDIFEALQYIRSSTRKMDALLSGLLKLSRLGRAALSIVTIDMNRLMKEVVESFDYQLKEYRIDLVCDDLPPCKGDVVQINQVFSNLLDNAIKYLDPERTGVIRIYGNRQDGLSLYTMEDNGIGIDPSHREKIFEIFHRLNPADKTGEGLGLAIVQRILVRHQGSVSVDSEPGSGSRFIVRLPVASTGKREVS